MILPFKKTKKYVLLGRDENGNWEELEEFDNPISSSEIIEAYPEYQFLRLEEKEGKRRIRMVWKRENPKYKKPNPKDIIKDYIDKFEKRAELVLQLNKHLEEIAKKYPSQTQTQSTDTEEFIEFLKTILVSATLRQPQK